jgi:hypothetical protein
MLAPRRIVTALITAGMLGVFSYGLLRFPDAPLHPCGLDSYCGKQGQPHSEKEYRAFVLWQSTLEWTWLPGMLALLLLTRGAPGWWRHK